MYDTIIFEFDYSKDGVDYDIDAKIYLEDNSMLIDRKYKESRDAVATQRVRYFEIEEINENKNSAVIVSKRGNVYIKDKGNAILKDFCDELKSIVENYNRTY